MNEIAWRGSIPMYARERKILILVSKPRTTNAVKLT